MKEGGGNIRKEVKRELERIAECAKRERERARRQAISHLHSVGRANTATA